MSESQKFVKGLRHQVELGYDPERLSNWVLQFYPYDPSDLPEEINLAIDHILLVSSHPEPSTLKELKELADSIENLETERMAREKGIYTPGCFAQELSECLSNKYDPYQVARWASDTYFAHCRDLQGELEGIVRILMAMENGPEFHLSTEGIAKLRAKIDEISDQFYHEFRKSQT